MATAWCSACGIFEKMFSDAKQASFQGQAGTEVDKPLSLWHLAPSFLLIATGLSISLIAFCGEILLNRCKKRTQGRTHTDINTTRSIRVRMMAE